MDRKLCGRMGGKMKNIILYGLGVLVILFVACAGAFAATTQPTLIKQAPNVFAFQVPPDAHFYIHDLHVSAGGIIHANQGAYSIYCENVWADKPPKGTGIYPFICATVPVQSFVLDNTRRRLAGITTDDIVNGSETGIRLMGRGGSAKIINVNMRCDTHDFWDPTGIFRHTFGVKQVFWKDIMALRDFDWIEVEHCRIIGPIRAGEQKNTAKTRQFVKYLYIHDSEMTDLPTVDTPGTVWKIVYHNNKKIDNKGKVVGKWPDRN
jgi:hypothetical protein